MLNLLYGIPNLPDLNWDIAVVSDQKSSGTSAGTSSAGSNTRTLNTLKLLTANDTLPPNIGYAPSGVDANWIKIDGSTTFTLQAGSYVVYGSVPAYQCLGTQAFLNVTSPIATVAVSGTSSYSQTESTYSILFGGFSLNQETVFNITQNIGGALITTGLGRAATAGVSEIYTQIMIMRMRQRT